jgi:hypothetical protein
LCLHWLNHVVALLVFDLLHVRVGQVLIML